MLAVTGNLKKKMLAKKEIIGKIDVYYHKIRFYFISEVVSNDGQFPECSGLQNDYLGSGPMCRYAEDLLPLLKIMAGPTADKYISHRYKPDSLFFCKLVLTTSIISQALPLKRGGSEKVTFFHCSR